MMAVSELKSMTFEESKITVGEKIVCHLGEYNANDKFVMPYVLTQDGIAVASGITRAHASVELKKLREKVYVEMRKSHVSGCKTLRNVYLLSTNGREHCHQIMERIGVNPRVFLYPQNKEEKGIRNPGLIYERMNKHVEGSNDTRRTGKKPTGAENALVWIDSYSCGDIFP